LSVLQSVWPHTSGNARLNFITFSVHVVVARSSSGGVPICYILPVLWITACFLIMGSMAACDTTAAVLMQSCVRVNTPAAWYWLRPVLDDDGRQDWTSSLSQGCKGRSVICTISLFFKVLRKKFWGQFLCIVFF